MLTVDVESGRHPAALRRWFPGTEPDPFYDESVLTALYGDSWSSVVIEEGGHALRHAFAASAIGTTGLLDIEPLVGYAGPLATSDAPAEFLAAALKRYSALCRESGIVAELIRFNPLLRNHRPLDGLIPDLALAEPKPVIYLPIQRERQEQMPGYPRATRNMVRTGERSARVAVLDKADAWSQFEQLYDRTLEATTAPSQWQMQPDVWVRMRHHPGFRLIGAVQDDRLLAGALALTSSSTWYYFLAAGVREPDARRGVSNAVVHEIALTAAIDGASWLGLGGGTTGSMTDSLFAFKNSFGGEVVPFTVGRFIHDRREHGALLETAERGNRTVSESALFLRYRLAAAYATGRMVPAPIRPLAGRTP